MRDFWEQNVENSDIAQAKKIQSTHYYYIWIVPLIAFIAGGWMLYKYYEKLGPLVIITFKNSGGLEPKQSFVKFRDVKVGTVEKILLSKRDTGVVVYVRMNKDVDPFLNKNARFWIVKPEIGLGKIRGLDALMSGAYIQMDSKLGGAKKYIFRGYEEPPLMQNTSEGTTFLLQSTDSYALRPGAPVYYKSVQVGSIKKIDLTDDGTQIEFYIFVRSPYDKFINDTTLFWNVKSYSLKLHDNGFTVDMGSLEQLIVGGVSFATKELDGYKTKKRFYLFKDKEEALQNRLGTRHKELPFLMKFTKGSGYLHNGAPVKFQGFRVGRVYDINATIMQKDVHMRVKASIDVDAFGGVEQLDTLVQKGLKATLKQDMLLTKNLHIELVFDGKGEHIQKIGKYYLFPTKEAQSNKFLMYIEKILTKLEHLPLKNILDAATALLRDTKEPLVQMLQDIRQTSKALRTLLEANATKELPQQLVQNLQKLQTTLQSFNDLAKTYSKDSLFEAKLSQTLHDIDKASKSLNRLLLKLEQKPNALLFGD